MVSQEEFLEMLEKIADEMPREFFQELNSGILLMPEAKIHPDSDPRKLLWIMGEYRISPTLGRSICIYYGSFEKLHGDLDKEALQKSPPHGHPRVPSSSGIPGRGERTGRGGRPADGQVQAGRLLNLT